MNLLPVFLDLSQQNVLLVGAGHVALQKAIQLLDAGARVRVVAPEALPQMQGWADEHRVDWTPRAFEHNDLEDCILAIAATNSSTANESVYQEATRRGILVNSVDDPEHCRFFFSSNLRRGPLQIAISTGGQSPAFGQHLRDRIDAQLPADLGDRLRALGADRREVLRQYPSNVARTDLLKRLAQKPFEDVRFHLDACDDLLRKVDEQRPSMGTVYLVGAGPGDPELLTVKALRLLQTADVILHDDLVSPEILALARPKAELISVGKRCGEKRITQEEIHARMIDCAHTYRIVVRLKGGDPMLFGRAAEEMAALRAVQVPYQIVPGITAAFAAAAAAGCSLTSRTSASGVLLTTGHLAERHNPAHALATRVVYMPGTNWQALAEKLQEEGFSPDLPCAIVSHASRQDESVVFSTLEKLGTLADLPAPSLLLLGEAIAAPSFANAQAAAEHACCAFDKR
jgi:uroporphyrin-III C-methyltransferase/precorrin-2 dehydrogenase/sirohydrochlorin ferrochelatase